MWKKIIIFYQLLLITLLQLLNTIKCSSTSTESSNKKTTLKPPVRVKNLDHWDDATISTYLHVNTKTKASKEDGPIDLPDAVILFYAQWSQNSHSLAPLYDKIATLLNAGYADSNRIMALYDCERSTSSKQICAELDISSYPTLMYVSQHTTFHDTDWFTSKLFGLKRSCGPMGCTKQKHSVKFQGDWRYGEEIYDWIVVMGGLSRWGKWSKGWRDSWKKRGGGGKKALTSQPLPVGIPESTTPTTTSSTNHSEELTKLQTKLDEVQKKSKTYQDATKHASLLIDSILFHSQDTNGTISPSMDPFAIIHKDDLWNKFHLKLPKEQSILLSCVMDLSIDYCTRHVLHVLETNTTDDTTAKTNDEPYCTIIDDCLKNNYKDKACQPASCPFKNSLGCDYVSSCLNGKVQKEYAAALGLED